MRPLQADFQFPVTSTARPAEKITLECDAASQRIWSRTGTAWHRNGSESLERYFVKQYVDRTGKAQVGHWQNELAGSRLAERATSDIVRVPQVRYVSEEHLISVFEYRPVQSMDEILRTNPALFDVSIRKVIETMRKVLDRLADGAGIDTGNGLPVASRPFGTVQALNFVGFELRNVGIDVQENNTSDDAAVVMFDCGKPYIASIEEAAAKIIVSVGLLNWGKPLRRFVSGPDIRLLDLAIEVLGPHADHRAVAEELAWEHKLRTQRVMGTGTVESLGKRIGINTIGRWYLRKLADHCERSLGGGR